MKPKALVPRARARDDVDQAVAYYLAQEAPAAALGFVDALERAYAHIGKHPATGSPRYAHALDIPGLRSWTLGKSPYLVFYAERAGHIDIWRVLHMRRDIPAWMADGGDEDF